MSTVRAIACLALGAASTACDDGVAPTGATLPAATDEPNEPPWFEECAVERGIDFVHDSGHGSDYLFPEVMSTGAALFDMDGDGDLDAYLVQGGDLRSPDRPPNRLYENVGGGHFRDVTEGSGADDRGYGMGVATGDYDGDGDVDLYVTNVGQNALLANDGTGRFVDVTATAGVLADGWSTSAAFLDYDADGDLDLFVASYIYWSIADELHCEDSRGADYCSPKSYGTPAPDFLYRNDGQGRFTDVSRDLGLRTAFGNGLGVVCADFNGDGRTDIFVANDGTTNQLWIQQPTGGFRDRAMLAGCAVDQNGRAKAGMGVAVADVDGDGDEDLLVVNLGGESDSYYRNEGTHFSDRTPSVGLARASRASTRFGCGLLDFDNDGHLDLFLANGRVTRAAEATGSDPYAEANLLMRGVASGRFTEALPRGGVRVPLVATSRAAAFGDVDGDGGIDVLVANRDGPAHLLRNVCAPRGEWLRARAVEANGADAFGATVEATIAGHRVVRRIRSAYSYCAANDPAAHFGLGDAERVDELVVRWVDGTREAYGPHASGGTVVLTRGAGAPVER